MAYAYVEDNEVKKIVDILPRNWKNISGLYLSENNDSFLNSHGWYRVIKQPITINDDTHKVSSFEYTLNQDHVIETPIIVEKLEEEIVTFEMKKIRFIEELRIMRNQLIQETDWTQLSDVVEFKSEEFRLQWREYRKKLRDMTEEYQENHVINLDVVVWPEKPEILD